MGSQVPFREVEGVPGSTVEGHAGFFTSTVIEGVPIIIAAGRLHLYEGLDPREVVAPVEALAETGIVSCLLTCAVGTVTDVADPGETVAICDQLNLTGADPATATGRFPDVSALYDRQYLDVLKGCGLVSGVLAGVRGPSYETPAETRVLKAMGADLVCMSTVLEALELAGHGVRLAALAAVANRAGTPGTSHRKVLEEVSRAAEASWGTATKLLSWKGPAGQAR
jgi:purine-nucleoside phosphorylase